MPITKCAVPVFIALAVALACVIFSGEKSPSISLGISSKLFVPLVPDKHQTTASDSLHINENPKATAPSSSPYADLVQQKYAIVFSSLKLAPALRAELQTLLQAREAIAARNFYDASSNSAEVAENLRQRDQAIAEQDQRIAQLLTPDDAKKYQLLKDSTYEQALLNGFYQVAGMENVADEQKLNLLLGKLEQKQKLASLIGAASDEIANAAPATKKFLIQKTHEAVVAEQQAFLRNARSGLSEEQFQLLQTYEQQLGDERWGELVSGWE